MKKNWKKLIVTAYIVGGSVTMLLGRKPVKKEVAK